MKTQVNNSQVNNKPVIYTLDFDPIALARIRVAINSNCCRVWDSQKSDKLVCGITIRNQHNQHGDAPLYKGPLLLDVTFYMRIKRTNTSCKPNQYHCYTPDLDNMIKYTH